MNNFDDDYWLSCYKESKFPHKYYEEITDGGWLGICLPQEYGGSALGIREASIFMQKVAETGGGMAAASSIHINIFGPHPIVVHGNDKQRSKWLPPLISGKEKTCFGVTEPDSGLDTGKLKTTAKKINNGYIINGQKIWTSTAQIADKILLLARTTPIEECTKGIDGLTLFYTNLDRKKIEVREIAKMGRAAVDSNQIFIDNLEVDEFDRVGEEGKGFRYLLDSLNPERILIAAECIGDAKWFTKKSTNYANDRNVFGRPIGQNQGIQFPIAKAYTQMKAAELMGYHAARLYEAGKSIGEEANTAKLLAADASWAAAEACVQTHGGFGFAEEYDVERKFREARLYQVAPISTNLILSYIAEHVLGMPRSY
jgi:acyl-CoA dehydrogenase